MHLQFIFLHQRRIQKLWDEFSSNLSKIYHFSQTLVIKGSFPETNQSLFPLIDEGFEQPIDDGLRLWV